jgi:hypothetical protein
VTSSRRFLAEKPLQVSKFCFVVGVLAVGLVGFFGLVPGRGLDALLLVPFASFALAVVVAGEALLAAYRVVRADDPPTARLAARPGYTVVRAVEAVVAVLAVGGVVGTLAALPDEPMPGPGAIGLLFAFAALGLLVLVASLVRTAAEYVYYRREPGGEPAAGSPA